MLTAGERHFPRLLGLDGLRAVAVTAVVLYHAGVGWLPGGFLGVEVFFVISGYLITALLVAEWDRTSTIDVLRFWLRRARRLLPALFALLAAVLLAALVWFPTEVARLRGDTLASLAYVTNWYLIAGEQSYFETLGRPSPLLHLWSLGIEEQFYVAWPLVLAVLLRAGGLRGVVVASVAVAVLSAAWMAVLFDPALDPSRVYYGTDTRLSGLLLGAALGCVWVPDGFEQPPSAARGMAMTAVALAALLGLGGFFALLGEADPILYRGGFLALGLVTVALIATVVHPWSLVGRALEAAPLRWIGTRSYSIYLWHWPIFTFTRPGLDLPLEPGPAFVLRLGLTAVLAELSYRYVEMPIRRGALGRLLTPSSSGRRLTLRRRPAFALGALVLASTVLIGAVAAAPAPAAPDYLAGGPVDGVVRPEDTPEPSGGVAAATATAPPTAEATPAVTATAGGTRTPATTARATATARPTATRAPTPRPTPVPVDGDILVLGDSVIVAVHKDLARVLGPISVDADVGRQTWDLVSVVRQRRAQGRLADNVVINIGNNGYLTGEQFDAIMSVLRDVRRVVWVNLSVPRPWETGNNRVIASGVARHPNARVADWHAAADGRRDLFWEDGYHPRPEGAQMFARLVAEALR